MFELIQKPKQIIEFPTGRILDESEITPPQRPSYMDEIDSVIKSYIPIEKITKAIDEDETIQDKEAAKKYLIEKVNAPQNT